MTPPTPVDDAHHNDNQRRFMTIETKLDANTSKLDANTEVTEKLATDMAGLLEMWKDAGVFFKWMRRAGESALWVSKVVLAIGALYALWRYGAGEKP